MAHQLFFYLMVSAVIALLVNTLTQLTEFARSLTAAPLKGRKQAVVSHALHIPELKTIIGFALLLTVVTPKDSKKTVSAQFVHQAPTPLHRTEGHAGDPTAQGN